MQQKKFPLKQIAIGLAIILVIFLGFEIVQNLRFRVTSTDPSSKNVAANSPSFNINFSKTLSPNGMSLSMIPNAIKSYAVNKKTLTIKLNYPLNTSIAYTLTVRSISSLSGSKIASLTYTFEPKNIPYNKLSTPQQQELFNNQDKNQPSVLTDPITAHLPYNTINYTLTAVVAGQGAQSTLTIDAQILLSSVDMSDETTAVNQYKQSIADYIRSFGLDPAKYIINYTVVPQ